MLNIKKQINKGAKERKITKKSLDRSKWNKIIRFRPLNQQKT